jgi:hypothetical protein
MLTALEQVLNAIQIPSRSIEEQNNAQDAHSTPFRDEEIAGSKSCHPDKNVQVNGLITDKTCALLII